MSKWVELKHSEGNVLIDFEKVFEIYIENKYINANTGESPCYVVLVDTINKTEKSYINCKSELEAQMVYAKLKKFLTDNKGLKEIEL